MGRAVFARIMVAITFLWLAEPYLWAQGLGDVPLFRRQLPQSLPQEKKPAEIEGQVQQPFFQEPEALAPKPYEEARPSRIEAEFRERYGSYLGEELRQFGYDFFVQSRRVITQVGDDYVLGPGDKVKFYFSGDPVEIGALQSEYVGEVGPDGRVYVPGAGLVSVSGLTLRTLREMVSGELQKRYKGLTVQVVLEALRTFNVYVSGFVKNPGMYAVTSLDTVISALALAGGVDKKGSLRRVVVRQRTASGWAEKEIDLYEMFVKGKPVDVLLKDGDVIHVGPIGPVVAVGGDVKRAGIYELKEEKSLREVLELAGGLYPFAFPELVRVFRYEGDRAKATQLNLLTEGGDALQVQDGDLIVVAGLTQDVKDVVFVEGDVDYPGAYSLEEVRRLSTLIQRAKPRVTADLRIGKIVRKDKTTVNFVPEEVLSGRMDIELEDGDRIFIPSRYSREPVYVWGEVKEARTVPYYEGLRLMDVLRDLEFKYDIRDLKAVIYMEPETMAPPERGIEAKQRPQVPSSVQMQAEGLGVTSGTEFQFRLPATLHPVPPKQDLAKREATKDVDKKAPVAEVYLYDLFVRLIPEANLELKPGMKVVIQRTFKTEKVPTVTVLGHVLRPGKYELRKGMTLAEALRLSGGLTEGAYLKGLILIRQSAKKAQEANLELAFAALEEALFRQEEGMTVWAEEERKMAETGMARARQYLSILRKRTEKNLGRIALEVPETLEELERSKANLLLEDGDEIIVPARPGYVLVLGDVYNPIALPYQRGMTVRDYLEMVGGATRGADTKDIYVIKANGKVISQRTYGKPFFLGASLMSYKLEEGDAVVVPTKIKVPVLWRPLIKDVVQIIFQSITTAVLAKRL